MRQTRLRLTTTILGTVLILSGVALFFAAQPIRSDVALLGWASLLVAGSLVVLGVFLVCLAAFPSSRTRRPVQRVREIDTDLAPDDALARIVRFVAQHRGAVTRLDTSHLDASLGSQLALRLTGVTTQFGTDRLPYRIDVDTRRLAGRTRLRVSFVNDEGWYLVSSRSLEDAYERRFAYVMAVLTSRLDGDA